MITKKVNRKLKWVDIQKEICNEDYTKTIYVFGIRIYKYAFNVTHDLPIEKEMGFGTQNG